MIISQSDNGQKVTNSATQQGSIVENGVQAHNTNQKGHCTFKVKKQKLSLFSGDMKDYTIFRT